jgi:hypothetical protein
MKEDCAGRTERPGIFETRLIRSLRPTMLAVVWTGGKIKDIAIMTNEALFRKAA